MKRNLVMLTVLFTLLLMLPAMAQEKKLKIGYIDLKRVYEESGKKEAFDEKIRELKREKDLALIEMKDKISAMQKMMLELGDVKRREKALELKQREIDFEKYRNDAKRDLNRKMGEYERKFAAELKGVVTDIGDEKGYTYILSDITILYSDSAYDLTDDAIAALKEITEKRSNKLSSKDK